VLIKREASKPASGIIKKNQILMSVTPSFDIPHVVLWWPAEH